MVNLQRRPIDMSDVPQVMSERASTNLVPNAIRLIYLFIVSSDLTTEPQLLDLKLVHLVPVVPPTPLIDAFNFLSQQVGIPGRGY